MFWRLWLYAVYACCLVRMWGWQPGLGVRPRTAPQGPWVPWKGPAGVGHNWSLLKKWYAGAELHSAHSGASGWEAGSCWNISDEKLHVKTRHWALRIEERRHGLEKDFGGRTSTGVLSEGIWPQGGKNWLRWCKKFIDVTVVYGLWTRGVGCGWVRGWLKRQGMCVCL